MIAPPRSKRRRVPAAMTAWRAGAAIPASIMLVAVACERMPATGGAPAPAAPSPRAARLPEVLTARIEQRTEIHLPEGRPEIVVTVGDVTGGAVVTMVESTAGESLAAPRSMRRGESVDFPFDGDSYSLTITELENHLVGRDFVAFEIRRAASSAGADAGTETANADVAASIERLLGRVAASAEIRFIRNGTEYSSAEAADHLRRKWSAAVGRVRTVDEFIDLCGSRSSVSGEPYLVRFPDGREIGSRDFLRSLVEAEKPAR